MTAYAINVYGHVQGVGFRYYTRQQAEALSLCGHVENMDDGSVFIFVQGEQQALYTFLSWCHQGPESAAVEKLEYESKEIKDIDSFEIKR